MPRTARLLLLALPTLSTFTRSFVHDRVLPHHTPKSCPCANWSGNTSAENLWANRSASSAAGASCAMPANALTPDLALPVYSPADGWCLCDRSDVPGEAVGGEGATPWYTWCEPPAAVPSQLNLLVVNSSAVVANFVTADEGARSGCVVEAEITDSAGATRSISSGYSTRYHDSEGTRVLSYHHVALPGLSERTDYRYRVRVSNRSMSDHASVTTWRKTTGIKWCSGGNWKPGRSFGHGMDGAWCPLLPPTATHDEKVAMCEAVCAAPNATACAGFSFYPDEKGGECCFRSSTEDKPADPESDAECYEKLTSAAPCTSTPSEWSEWNSFKSLYSSGVTRFALYADMGVFVAEGPDTPPVKSLPAPARHNVGNLVDDLHAGLIDFAFHSGDHAYEFEVSDGARGDGYMDSYSAFLAHAPWAPGWGNHEYLEEDRGNRLANITAGAISERRKVQTGTNRMMYSVEVGLLHLCV